MFLSRKTPCCWGKSGYGCRVNPQAFPIWFRVVHPITPGPLDLCAAKSSKRSSQQSLKTNSHSGFTPRKLIHPGRLTWNLKMMVWKMIFLFNWVVFRFHVNLPGCMIGRRFPFPFLLKWSLWKGNIRSFSRENCWAIYYHSQKNTNRNCQTHLSQPKPVKNATTIASWVGRGREKKKQHTPHLVVPVSSFHSLPHFAFLFWSLL